MISREEQAYLVQAWNTAPDAARSGEAQAMVAAETARIHHAFAHLPIRVQFVDFDPYQSFEQMRDQVQSTRTMLVWTGASETPLWDPQTNWMARAVHDWDHIVRSCDFSMEGEAEAFRNAAACRPGLAPLYLSEVMLQAAIANYTGAFVPQKLVLAPEEVQRRARQMRGANGGRLGRMQLQVLQSVRDYGKLCPPNTDYELCARMRGVGFKLVGRDLIAIRPYNHPDVIAGHGQFHLTEAGQDALGSAAPRGVGALQGLGAAAAMRAPSREDAELVWSTAGILRVSTPQAAMVHLRAQDVSLEDALVIVDAAQQLNARVDSGTDDGDYLARRRGGFDGVGAAAATEIARKDLRVGDEVGVVGNHAGRVSGEIASIGRSNVKITSRVRFSPTGPVHTQVHTIPITSIDVVVRQGVVVFDRRGLHRN